MPAALYSASRTPNQSPSLIIFHFPIPTKPSNSTPLLISCPITRLSTPHQACPNRGIDHAAHAERRHDPRHARERTDGPIPPYPIHPVPDALPPLAIKQVEAEEVEGRADELHERRSEELGGVGSRGGGREERVVEDRGQMGQVRCDQWGEVEGCKDGEGVAQGEEEVA